MGKPKIYIALPESDANLKWEDRQFLREFAEVIQHSGKQKPTDEEKLMICRDVDGVVIGRSGGWLTREMIDAAKKLKVVGVIGGSVVGAQPDYLLNKGIAVINTGWAMSPAVAEFTLAMMLCGLRDIPHMISSMQQKGWGTARNALDLTGKTVGLIGFGMIARRVAELLKPFQNDIRVFDPYVAPEKITGYDVCLCGLDELLSQSLVVSIHAGLTDETQGMIGAHQLAFIPDGGLLVNTARAGVVDEKALIAELKTGRIRAALNVFWTEPLSIDHPLRSFDNVILTPHGGGLTQDTMLRHSRSIARDLKKFFAGEDVQNLVSREMLERMT